MVIKIGDTSCQISKLIKFSEFFVMAQINPEQKYVVVSNSNMLSEVQESEITSVEDSFTPVVKETSSIPVVNEKFNMESYRDEKKVVPTKVHTAFVVLILLVLALFLAVITLGIAFAIEIPKLKSASPSAEQQSGISAAATIMERLDILNSSMDGLSQQLLQVIDNQTKQVASSLLQQVNSSLELLSQQLLQDISAIDSRTQQINSSQQTLSQQLLQDISAIDSRTQQINSSQQMLSEQLLQDISAIDSRTQQINTSQQIISQQLLQDISAIDSRTQQINSSQQMLSQQLLEDVSAIDSRIQQINSSQQMTSEQLLQDISAIDSRTQQLNSSQQILSQQLLEDVSVIDSRIEQVNSSQQMISEELLQDISAIDSRIEQVNSSQQMISEQLLQDISAIDNKIEQVNSSQQMISEQLLQDISAIDSRIEQVNSSQQMISEQLLQDISAIDSRIEQVNSSQQMISEQLLQDISAIDSRIEQVNSSQQITSEQLFQEVTAIDSQTQQINSSQQMFSQQLLQDITAIDSRVEQINISLSQQVNDVQTQAQETVDGLETLGEFQTFPASSCAAILDSLPSGYYYVRASNGSAVLVYCDMTLTCGGVTGGWQRVVDLDFNSGNDSCPDGLREEIDSERDLRTCVKGSDSDTGCTSTEYSASDVPYSSVCGKIIAYQVGTPEAFSRLIVISSLGISSQYLDGISLTRGNPMEHIWSFAVGVTEDRTDRFGCPCNVGSTVSTAVMNTFIGSNYFCDSAANTISSGTRYLDNPLFDGVGCSGANACCSFNNPPWFYRQLPQSTSDDIELRSCRDENGATEGVLIQSIELYVR